MALYNGHSVEEISRSDASAINLSQTSEDVLASLLNQNVRKNQLLCNWCSGSGKTFVGLNIATTHIDHDNYIVFFFPAMVRL